MGPNYIALAIPFFFLFIGLELLVARRKRRQCYRFADAVADLGCGITQQVTTLFFTGALLAGYTFLYERFALIRFDEGSVWPWLVAVLGVDFLYYWWHRLSHEVNFLWAAHVVHHQSEDYNLAVALRQATATSITVWPFYAVLAFVGVPPLVFATAAAFNTLYQFWIHTELVPKLGVLERLINTPSAHRVHHAINPQYLDKNYGGTFMVFDRVFGTYREEQEQPVYGITHPLQSFNPLWAQVHYWAELVRRSRRAPNWREALKVWFASPAWHPEWMGETSAPPLSRAKYDPQTSASTRRYVLAQFTLVVVATFALLMWGNALSTAQAAAAATLILVSLLSLTGLLESKQWARPLEVARLALVVAAFAWAAWQWRAAAPLVGA